MKASTSTEPKHAQLRELLREEVQRRLANDDFETPMPSEHQLTKQYKVSRTTVRRALSDLTKESLLVAEQGKGCFIRDPATVMAARVRLGILLHDELPLASELFLSELIASIEQAAKIRGHNITLIRERGDSHGAWNVSEVAGLFLLLPNVQMADSLRPLIEAEVPMVAISSVLRQLPIPSVETQNYAGAQLMARHLLELGHREIALIAGPLSRTSNQDRLQAWQDAMAEYDVPWREERLVSTVEATEEAGMRLGRQLLALNPRPTAIVGFNDRLAIGALRLAHLLGLRVPEDLSIVGFDDLHIGEYTNPPLTTVHGGHKRYGEVAYELMMAQLEHREIENLHQMVPSELIIRQSTSKPCR